MRAEGAGAAQRKPGSSYPPSDVVAQFRDAVFLSTGTLQRGRSASFNSLHRPKFKPVELDPGVSYDNSDAGSFSWREAL